MPTNIDVQTQRHYGNLCYEVWDFYEQHGRVPDQDDMPDLVEWLVTHGDFLTLEDVCRSAGVTMAAWFQEVTAPEREAQ